jgi:anti-sigma B factor antagonist
MDRQPPQGPSSHGTGARSAASVQVEYSGRVVVARIRGEIDTSNVSDVERVLQTGVSAEALGLVVDLTGVDYFNSTTIKMLFGIFEQLRERGQQLRVAINDDAPMRTILSLVNLEQLIPLHTTAEDAEAWMAKD